MNYESKEYHDPDTQSYEYLENDLEITIANNKLTPKNKLNIIKRR